MSKFSKAVPRRKLSAKWLAENKRSFVVYDLGRKFYLENEARLKKIAKELRNGMEVSHFFSTFELLGSIQIGFNARPGFNAKAANKRKVGGRGAG
jgi:hypothetical protein